MQRYLMGIGKMTRKGEVGLMDFSSDREDEKDITSSTPRSMYQSHDDQFSETESHDEAQAPRVNSISAHVQVPGHMADISYAPAAISTGGSSGNAKANSSMESSILSDVIRVDITDLDGHNESINLTTTTLKRCKEQVLRPYWRLLMFIGWRGFGRESINPNKWYWRLLNILYFIILLMIIMYSYIYEVIACEWKLNVHEDTVPVTKPTTTIAPTTVNSTATTTRKYVPWEGLSSASPYVIATNSTIIDAKATSSMCEHVITTYVIPNILHFVAYIIGFIYFRIMENEQLYALMEKVFLQASPLQGRLVSQSNMIKKLRLFLGLGAAWVVLTIVLQVLYVLAFGLGDIKGPLHSESQYWAMVGFQVIGILLTSSISLAVVVNYGSQCEILIFFINGIQMRIQEKTGDLRSMMKDILAVRHSLGQLNGAMSRMTSIMVIKFAEMVVIGVTILIINQYDDTMIWIYRAFFPCVWVIILLFPLIQAARTNSACAKFKRIALETRVFGYQNSSLLELDSFLLFVSNTRLQAKMFHLPIRAPFLIGFIVFTSFVMIILMQPKLFHIPIKPSNLAGISVICSFLLLIALQSGIVSHKVVPFWI